MRICKMPYPAPAASDQPRAAEEQARAVLKLDPEDTGAYVDLGKSLLSQDQYAEAYAALKRPMELQPFYENDLELKFFRAICQAYLREHANALTFLTNELAYNQSRYPPESLERMKYEIARLHAIASDPKVRNGKKAMELVRPLNEANKFTNWEFLWVLAAAHAELGQFDDASRRIVEARVLAPENQKPFLEKVEKLFASKQAYQEESILPDPTAWLKSKTPQEQAEYKRQVEALKEQQAADAAPATSK
jgi:tetratricopeptide (TPR) repeat protein